MYQESSHDAVHLHGTENSGSAVYTKQSLGDDKMSQQNGPQLPSLDAKSDISVTTVTVQPGLPLRYLTGNSGAI